MPRPKHFKHSKRLIPSPALAKKRLRFILIAFFLALFLPFGLLTLKVNKQLEREAYYNFQKQAEDLVSRINLRIFEILKSEDGRPFGEYQFFSVSEAQFANKKELAFSPLSKLPLNSPIPGIVGYFQINPDGKVITPFLPDVTDEELFQFAKGYQMSLDDVQKRIKLRNHLRSVLKGRKRLQDGLASLVQAEEKLSLSFPKIPKQKRRHFELITSALAQSPEASQGVDREHRERSSSATRKMVPQSQQIQKGYVPAPNSLDSSDKAESENAQFRSSEVKDFFGNLFERQAPSQKEVGKIIAPQEKEPKPLQSPSKASGAELEDKLENFREVQKSRKEKPASEQAAIVSFEGIVEPYQLSVLSESHFALFRKVILNNTTYFQGLLVRSEDFLKSIVQSAFDADNLSTYTTVTISHRGQTYRTFSSKSIYDSFPESMIPQFRLSLSPPLDSIELVFSAANISSGQQTTLLRALAGMFTFVLLAGLVFIYRLGAGHIMLAKQQSDFVSAVSHELKTPLTSIRMYGEMLREGWVTDEQKKRSYYDFIFFESERLSRLISNVLQLAKLSSSKASLELHKHTANELLDLVKSKVSTQVDAAGYTLEIEAPNQDKDIELLADADAFSQVMINLVDNAIKFSAQAENKTILVGYRHDQGGHTITFYVRDFGPGVERRQMKKIFRLFYRVGNELTRTTSGTGIGLALVKALTQGMGASIDLENKTPGAEFQVTFLFSSVKKAKGETLKGI